LTLACVLPLTAVAWADEPSTHDLPPPRAPVAVVGETVTGEGPDLLLIAFSGRCALRSCTPPDENVDALARRLVPAALARWRAAGLEVEA
jgi:hypothetical protein